MHYSADNIVLLLLYMRSWTLLRAFGPHGLLSKLWVLNGTCSNIIIRMLVALESYRDTASAQEGHTCQRRKKNSWTFGTIFLDIQEFSGTGGSAMEL